MTTEIQEQEELRERIITMLRDNVDDPSMLDDLDPDADLTALGVNSLTFIKLVIAAEMEFGLTWNDDDLDFRHFSSVNSILNYVQQSGY
ncbi:phosphopantetheine-binding protein [Paenibacillus methanolicus]|uniref:Acyl carrier protein n=1 Tax=Paenibacillus methanolicus TaxID=582686 RepID=A0A5S5BZA9_9BACL|nr:phosphopantetheine-binding protein [Paenibacillus methanolicus]TYP72394.1 acyl carrier protein [Paenibacillus methanolicus]